MRRVLFWTIAGCSAVATITYVLPGHRSSGDVEDHSCYADGGYIPLLGLAAVTALVAWLSTRRFGAGLIASIIAAIAAVLEFGRWLFAHWTIVQHTIDHVHLAMLTGMFGLGVILLFIEPVLYVVERSSQERAERAERAIPTARVVSS